MLLQNQRAEVDVETDRQHAAKDKRIKSEQHELMVIYGILCIYLVVFLDCYIDYKLPSMLIRHAFSLGDLVLAKTEGHPYWPARIQACIKNGCYLVRFFGEKTEASVMPEMVMQFTLMNMDRLRKEKELANGKNFKDAIRLTQRVLEERMRGNLEFEEEALMGKMQMKKVDKTPGPSVKEASLNRSIYSSSLDHSTSKIPASREVKTLLDRLVKHCADFTLTASTISPAFTQHDEKRLLILLDPISGISLQ